MTISCKKHPKCELKFFCEDDETLICDKCIVTKHGGHRVSSIHKVAESNRDKIKAARVKTMKRVNVFKKEVAIEIASEKEDSGIREAIIKEVENQAQEIVRQINDKKETLISKVKSAHSLNKNRDILEHHHNSLQSTCDFAQELITNGTDYDIMVQTKPLTEKLAAMEKIPVPTRDKPAQISYSSGEITAAELESMLGQVTLQTQAPLPGLPTYLRPAPYPPVFLEKAECVDSFSPPLKGDTDAYFDVSGLAILNEEHMFVVNKNRTKMFTHAGEFKFDIELYRPVDVAVSQTGQLYITTESYVKVYSIEGSQKATMGNGILKLPCGITMNRQGHVMVCDREMKAIFTFHADSGELLDTIPLSMCKIPVYITVNNVNDNIVISDIDWDKRCVHVLSPTGEQLYQYSSTRDRGDVQLWFPCGVCTDSYGHIFIADCENHRIVALSSQGQFIRYIATKDDGLNSPTALAINPAGQLVVIGQKGQVDTYQYLQVENKSSSYCTLI